MDFFNRLLRRASNVPSPAAAVARAQANTAAANRNSPQQRLKTFKSVYAELLRLWRNGQGVSRDAFVAENVRVVIVRLSQTLNNDIRGPTPHLCVSFAFTNGVLRTLIQVATAFCETGITSEVLGVVQLVVDNEEEAFLEDRGLADVVPPFVEAVRKDILGRQWTEKEEEVEKLLDREVGLEARLAEILFGIASAIRSKHLVLKAWFRPEQIYEDEADLTEEEKRTRMEDFPLFYALLDYISANGRVGDFARMGLLYIVEATAYSSTLERWLIEGDMAALMASSLGALYSQLSRKLIMAHIPGEEPLICKYGTIKAITKAPYDVDVMGSLEYQERTRTLMASLNFWQDMLNHSPFDNIRQTLLDHFQYLFLQQLLYPSLMESGDADGGVSAVAVISYLRNILREVEHPELLNRMLSYLFGLPMKEEMLDELATATTKARRRKSEILFAKTTGDEGLPNPQTFNLTDVIKSGLSSRSQETITVTLRLLSTLLTRQHQQSLPYLLRTRPVRQSEQRRSLGGHLKEIDIWINLAANLTSVQEIEESYEAAVYDNQSALEIHPCTYQVKQIDLPNQKEDYYSTPLNPYTIAPNDPITTLLVSLLDRFLMNDIETNLDLTRVILDIACCGHLRLEGWLLTHPSRYVYRKPDGTPQTQKTEKPQDEDEEAEDSNEADGEAKGPSLPPAREEPAWHAEDRSPIMKSLDRVVAKVESYHRTLQDFDILLSECRAQVTGAKRAPSVSEQTTHAAVDQSRLAAPSGSLPSAASTPARGHGRKTSLADRVANAFGTSPRQGERARSTLPGGPTPLERLEMRLSEATGTGRPRSSGRPNGAQAESPTPSPSKKRKVSQSAKQQPETPSKPMHIGRRNLRGEDLNASPSPRLDRRVVPGGGRREREGTSLKNALTNESDDDGSDESPDEDSDNGVALGSGSGSEAEDSGEGSVNGAGDSDDGEQDQSLQDGDGAIDSDSDDEIDIANGTRKASELKRDITVGHLLTNIIILQEFILEIAAMISVRGTTFGEIRFR